MAAGTQEEMFSFMQKFQHLSYNGFDVNLNFSSYQGIIYVNFNASLGPLMHPPQPVYTIPTYEKSSAKKCNQMKPSRIRRKRRREGKRHSQEEDVATDNLLDLDLPLQTNETDVMETIAETEEDRSNTTLDVTDSSFTEPLISSSYSQDYRPRPQNNSTSTSTAAVPDAKYWEQMYVMLLHLTRSTEKSSTSLNASVNNLSGIKYVNSSHASTISSPSYLR